MGRAWEGGGPQQVWHHASLSPKQPLPPLELISLVWRSIVLLGDWEISRLYLEIGTPILYHVIDMGKSGELAFVDRN